MAKRRMRKRMLTLVAAATMGGAIFQFGACSPEVRGTLLDGLESSSTGLVSAFIAAFFDSIGDSGTSGDSSLTTP